MRSLQLLILLSIISFSSSGQTKSKTSKPIDLFDEFKVDSFYAGEKHQIDYNSNPTAKRFRTKILTTYKKVGFNFGGHYCFVKWGCGSPCQASVIVDIRTGKVYSAPSAALGYDYRKDSRLLIVNPTDTTGFFVDCDYCKQEKWLFNEQLKKFEQK